MKKDTGSFGSLESSPVGKTATNTVGFAPAADGTSGESPYKLSITKEFLQHSPFSAVGPPRGDEEDDSLREDDDDDDDAYDANQHTIGRLLLTEHVDEHEFDENHTNNNNNNNNGGGTGNNEGDRSSSSNSSSAASTSLAYSDYSTSDRSKYSLFFPTDVDGPPICRDYPPQRVQFFDPKLERLACSMCYATGKSHGNPCQTFEQAVMEACPRIDTQIASSRSRVEELKALMDSCQEMDELAKFRETDIKKRIQNHTRLAIEAIQQYEANLLAQVTKVTNKFVKKVNRINSQVNKGLILLEESQRTLENFATPGERDPKTRGTQQEQAMFVRTLKALLRSEHAVGTTRYVGLPDTPFFTLSCPLQDGEAITYHRPGDTSPRDPSSPSRATLRATLARKATLAHLLAPALSKAAAQEMATGVVKLVTHHRPTIASPLSLTGPQAAALAIAGAADDSNRGTVKEIPVDFRDNRGNKADRQPCVPGIVHLMGCAAQQTAAGEEAELERGSYTNPMTAVEQVGYVTASGAYSSAAALHHRALGFSFKIFSNVPLVEGKYATLAQENLFLMRNDTVRAAKKWASLIDRNRSPNNPPLGGGSNESEDYGMAVYRDWLHGTRTYNMEGATVWWDFGERNAVDLESYMLVHGHIEKNCALQGWRVLGRNEMPLVFTAKDLRGDETEDAVKARVQSIMTEPGTDVLDVQTSVGDFGKKPFESRRFEIMPLCSPEGSETSSRSSSVVSSMGGTFSPMSLRRASSTVSALNISMNFGTSRSNLGGEKKFYRYIGIQCHVPDSGGSDMFHVELAGAEFYGTLRLSPH